MGVRASRTSREEKLRKEAIKEAHLQHNIEQLRQMKSMKSMKSSVKVSSNAMISQDAMISHGANILQDANFLEPLKATLVDIAIKQLDRSGKNLVKADLIAIVLSLKPEYITQVDQLQKTFTVEDLNALIRSILYDPERIKALQAPQALQIQQVNSQQVEQQQYDLIT
jgi:hypothetical protein